MEQIRITITAACMLSLAVGICNILKPSALFERQVRFLVSLIFVISVAGTLLRTDWQLSDALSAEGTETVQTAVLEETVQTQILEETARRTETVLYELLASEGIVCTELDVTVHMDAADCISISEVSAACSNSGHACEILRANLGEGVTLHVTENPQ